MQLHAARGREEERRDGGGEGEGEGGRCIVQLVAVSKRARGARGWYTGANGIMERKISELLIYLCLHGSHPAVSV